MLCHGIVNVERAKRLVAYKKISAFLGSYDGQESAQASASARRLREPGALRVT
jgi:hypothetical protein